MTLEIDKQYLTVENIADQRKYFMSWIFCQKEDKIDQNPSILFWEIGLKWGIHTIYTYKHKCQILDLLMDFLRNPWSILWNVLWNPVVHCNFNFKCKMKYPLFQRIYFIPTVK